MLGSHFDGPFPPALAEMVLHMNIRRYNRGQILYFPGDPSDVLFLLKAGRVQQYHLSPDGRKFVVDELRPGDIFGAITLEEDSCHSVFAETLDDCLIYVLHRARARQLLLRQPGTILPLLSGLARRLAQVESKLEAMVFFPLSVRLARYLIEAAENDVVEGASQQELGDVLGVCRSSVTLTLNEFTEAGLIETRRQRIQIRDRAGLSQIAYGDRVGDLRSASVPDWARPVPELKAAAA